MIVLVFVDGGGGGRKKKGRRCRRGSRGKMKTNMNPRGVFGKRWFSSDWIFVGM